MIKLSQPSVNAAAPLAQIHIIRLDNLETQVEIGLVPLHGDHLHLAMGYVHQFCSFPAMYTVVQDHLQPAQKVVPVDDGVTQWCTDSRQFSLVHQFVKRSQVVLHIHNHVGDETVHTLLRVLAAHEHPLVGEYVVGS